MTTFSVGSPGLVAVDPERNGGQDHALALVTAVHSDGTVDVTVFPPAGGEPIGQLARLTPYESRKVLEEALSEHFADIAGASGLAHPLKTESGAHRAPTVNDVLPWANGLYPLAADAGSKTSRKSTKDA